jgi:two-component system, sensor histidine kinase and response regulator
MKSAEQLISTLTHDVNNHLSATQSYLELLLSGSLNEAQEGRLGLDLLALTKNTAIMLANLLSWLRITSSTGLVSQPGRLSLGDAIRQVLDDQQSIAQNKEIDLSVKMVQEIFVLADPSQFQLVLRNLVNNALKFTPAGGKVAISIQPALGEVIIQIKDTGIGISPEQQKELFTPGWKVTFGTRNEKGLGLGLWLCKELLEKQKGRIWHHSSALRGSAFLISVPLP